jgi:hypothetical protein
MLRDDDAYPMPLRLSPSPSSELTELQPLNHDRQYVNDDFDDVFGSEPGSPTLGDEEGARGGNDERSDIPRLKEKHETEGYRDGVTKGKAESVQAGFDEGYGLGAVLGLRIGKILGLLEGIYFAIGVTEGEEWRVEKERVGTLYEDAQRELNTQSVFGREWWGEDGIWKYDVPGEGEGKEVVFPDIAAAHPLLKKWEENVDAEVQRWGLDLGIMDHEHAEEDDAIEDRAASDTKRPKLADGKEAAVEPVSSSTGLFMGIPKKDLNW